MRATTRRDPTAYERPYPNRARQEAIWFRRQETLPYGRGSVQNTPSNEAYQRSSAFTLVELLVVVSIIALLITILLPSLQRARKQGQATVCITRLRTLGQGLSMYALDHNDLMLPGRMPNLGDGINWQTHIAGGLKYRPTFLAMMGSYVGIPAFDDPMSTKAAIDRFGEAGDRQDYSNKTYICPSAAKWTDERNGCYGYNYQFLGNARLTDSGNPESFKNWTVTTTSVKSPSRCVAVADSMGTAASFGARNDYDNNSRQAEGYGNEGFNLDPPRVDPTNGEMANFDAATQSRTSVHTRHLDKAAVLWLDGHCTTNRAGALGYSVGADGVVAFDGTNHLFNIDGTDTAWVGTP